MPITRLLVEIEADFGRLRKMVWSRLHTRDVRCGHVSHQFQNLPLDTICCTRQRPSKLLMLFAAPRPIL